MMNARRKWWNAISSALLPLPFPHTPHFMSSPPALAPADDKTPLLINDIENGEALKGKEVRSLSGYRVAVFTSLQAGVSFMFGVSGGWLAFYYVPSEGTKLLNPVVYSLTVFLGRVFNGLLEPYIGYFSDRCTTKMGRRKPFILVASPLMSLTFALLWFMPFEPQSLEASLWFICLFVLNNFFGACVMAPYMALLPEVSNQKSERITISASMGVWAMVGSLFVAMVGPFDNWLEGGVDILGHNFTGLQLLCMIMAVMMTIFCWMPLLVAKERPVEAGQISDFSVWKELDFLFHFSCSLVLLSGFLWAQRFFLFFCSLLFPLGLLWRSPTRAFGTTLPTTR